MPHTKIHTAAKPSRISARNFLGVGSVVVALCWAAVRSSPQPLFYLNTDAQRALNWPNPMLRPEESYTQTSPVNAIVFQLSGQTSTNAWVFLHLIAIVISLLLLAWWLLGSLPTSSDRRAEGLRLLFLGPVTAVLLLFIGSYDPFTLIFMALALFAWRLGRKTVMVIAGFGLGLAHAEQALLAFSALALAVWGGHQLLPNALRGRPNPIWIVFGVVAGRSALSIYLATQGIGLEGGRIAWLTEDGLLRLAVVGGLNFLPILIMGCFAGLWVLVVVELSRATRWYTCLAWAGPLVLLFLFSLAVLDHTRVFVITSLPILLVLTLHHLSRDRSEAPRSLRLSVGAAAWLIVPVFILTSPDGPTFPVDLNILDHWSMWISRLTSGGWS